MILLMKDEGKTFMEIACSLPKLTEYINKTFRENGYPMLVDRLRLLTHDTSKILFGSDFPVSHYFATHLFNKNLLLKDEYIEDCQVYL